MVSNAYDHLEKYSSRLAPEVKETCRGTSSQLEQGNNRHSEQCGYRKRSVQRDKAGTIRPPGQVFVSPAGHCTRDRPVETRWSIVMPIAEHDLRRYEYHLLSLHGFAPFACGRRRLGKRRGLDCAGSVAFGVSECADWVDTTTRSNYSRVNPDRESRGGYAGSKRVHGF